MQQWNRNGIPINRHMSLGLLQVLGAEDPFEGRAFDPQFDAKPREREVNKWSYAHVNDIGTQGER